MIETSKKLGSVSDSLAARRAVDDKKNGNPGLLVFAMPVTKG